jgi:hypothetical protein
MKLLICLLTLVNVSLAQEILLSANPDLLYSTANDYGPWGAPEFINSPNNDFGPVGSPEWLGSVSNDYGTGLRPSELLLLTPNLITYRELLAPFVLEPVVELDPE